MSLTKRQIPNRSDVELVRHVDHRITVFPAQIVLVQRRCRTVDESIVLTVRVVQIFRERIVDLQAKVFIDPAVCLNDKRIVSADSIAIPDDSDGLELRERTQQLSLRNGPRAA